MQWEERVIYSGSYWEPTNALRKPQIVEDYHPESLLELDVENAHNELVWLYE